MAAFSGQSPCAQSGPGLMTLPYLDDAAVFSPAPHQRCRHAALPADVRRGDDRPLGLVQAGQDPYRLAWLRSADRLREGGVRVGAPGRIRSAVGHQVYVAVAHATTVTRHRASTPPAVMRPSSVHASQAVLT